LSAYSPSSEASSWRRARDAVAAPLSVMEVLPTSDWRRLGWACTLATRKGVLSVSTVARSSGTLMEKVAVVCCVGSVATKTGGGITSVGLLVMDVVGVADAVVVGVTVGVLVGVGVSVRRRVEVGLRLGVRVGIMVDVGLDDVVGLRDWVAVRVGVQVKVHEEVSVDTVVGLWDGVTVRVVVEE